MYQAAFTLMVNVTDCSGCLCCPSCKNSNPLECCVSLYSSVVSYTVLSFADTDPCWQTMSDAFTDMTARMVCLTIKKPIVLNQETITDFLSSHAGDCVC